MATYPDRLDRLHQALVTDAAQNPAYPPGSDALSGYSEGAEHALDSIRRGTQFILIDRDDLPETFNSMNGNGVCTALAQELHQPELYFHPADCDKPGEWNRKIAYANLAVAEAVEAREAQRETEAEVKLQLEAFALYVASCIATDTTPAPDWETACQGEYVERDFLAIARAARQIHGGAA